MLAIGAADILTALLVALGVFQCLPARWPLVDVPAAVLAVLELVSGAALILGLRWAPKLAAWTAMLALAMGVALVTVLALTASWLSGIYGPIGRSGALLLVLVAALAFPYLLVLPTLELLWLRSILGSCHRDVSRATRAGAAGTLALLVACFTVEQTFSLADFRSHPIAVVASLWEKGELVARSVLEHAERPAEAIETASRAHPDGTLIYESIVGEGRVASFSDAMLALSFVPGRDGVRATFEGRTQYVTPDDLLAHQAYENELTWPAMGLKVGVDLPMMWAILSERFGAPVRELVEHASLRRIRVVRRAAGRSFAQPVTADSMTEQDATKAAIEAGRFLARGMDSDGRFRYLVDAPTNLTLPGYDLPRHAGATYYLAQVASASGDGALREATLRAAGWMKSHAMQSCGQGACIGTGHIVDLGATALALLAFVEIARNHLDPAAAAVVPSLAAFLRQQQRSDGDFEHEYDLDAQRPVDIQLLYYTGEASLALSRSNALLGDARDIDAASRALAYLVGPGWSFFGSRYFFGEEHWTCQAMDDMWDRAPNRSALDFCLRWHAFGRRLQYEAQDTPYDAEGAYGFGPIVVPHLTPAASRSEAALATLDAGLRAGADPTELRLLELQARRSLALLIRHQFLPGPSHLFVDPSAVEGAFPASEVDWKLRIDFAQHAGSALLRWLARRPSEGHRREGSGGIR